MKRFALFAFIFLAACSSLSDQQHTNSVTNHAVEQNSLQEPGLIGGIVSKYYEWDKAKFDIAVAEGKTVYLEFSANWCPTCQSQEPHLKAGFELLNDSDVVGFKIHYKDDQTTPEMTELARKYGVAYQHTKVIIKNGEIVLKSPEAWEHTRFLEEMKRLK